MTSAGTLKTTARRLVSQAVAHVRERPSASGPAAGSHAASPAEATAAAAAAASATGDGVCATLGSGAEGFVRQSQRLTMLYCLMFKRNIHEQHAGTVLPCADF